MCAIFGFADFLRRLESERGERSCTLFPEAAMTKQSNVGLSEISVLIVFG